EFAGHCLFPPVLNNRSTLQASRGRLKPDLRTTPFEIQVVLGQGSADLLMTVVVFVHNPGRRPSPNRVPLQSAPSPADAGEVDPPTSPTIDSVGQYAARARRTSASDARSAATRAIRSG